MEAGEKNPAQWAIDLLLKPPLYEKPWYSSHYGELLLGFAGFNAPMFKNICTSKPMFAHFHHCIIGCGLGIIAGYVLTTVSEYYYARRDAIMVDYIRRHPERFPEPPKVTFGEKLDTWCPIR
ncbi:NADH dehydrogenase [ubiquinone] 1 subunit C2 [Hylaeus volcanicus]|uniref:NADH dehydrogenase [ubiquinone] 1 subunit C2 n=1 Tax=Hylaeus volcanicus TaxID=313075 RepID=UPI0023B86EC3|nr:NADH dehydrogenase [ubiquinone] 1 subunit C2 [Hylaeus volcanicus]